MLIPAENEKDLAEIPANVKEALEIVPVSHVDEVLAQALATPIVADRMDRRRRACRDAAVRDCRGADDAAGAPIRH